MSYYEAHVTVIHHDEHDDGVKIEITLPRVWAQNAETAKYVAVDDARKLLQDSVANDAHNEISVETYFDSP